MGRSKYKSKKGIQRVKVLFLISGILIVLIPVFIYSLTLSSSGKDSTQSSVNTTAGKKLVNQGVTLAPTREEVYFPPAAPEEEAEAYEPKEYVGNKFSVRYPDDWEVYSTAVEVEQKDDEAIILKPRGLPVNFNLPSVNIAASPNVSHPYLTEQQDFYKKSGFKQSDVYLGGLPATELRGEFSKQDTSGESYQEVRLFLEKDSYSYLVFYKYQGDAVDQEQEDAMIDIISSFDFK
jgi:hypothetical protein